jgi:CubicO group peptidase (beta-lactamase class C family)
MPYLFKQAEAEGGLHSTIPDMLKYIKFQLDEENRAVKLSHQVTYGNLNEMATGLFWSMDQAPNGNRDIWHSGGSFGFSNFCLISLDTDFGVILLSNEADPDKQNQIGKLAVEIKKAVN